MINIIYNNQDYILHQIEAAASVWEQEGSCDDVEMGRIVRNFNITHICIGLTVFLQNDNLSFCDMLKHKYRKQEHKKWTEICIFHTSVLYSHDCFKVQNNDIG